MDNRVPEWYATKHLTKYNEATHDAERLVRDWARHSQGCLPADEVSTFRNKVAILAERAAGVTLDNPASYVPKGDAAAEAAARTLLAVDREESVPVYGFTADTARALLSILNELFSKAPAIFQGAALVPSARHAVQDVEAQLRELEAKHECACAQLEEFAPYSDDAADSDDEALDNVVGVEVDNQM